MAALVPDSAVRILDVGCGGGKLGAHLKARQHCTVTGVEHSAIAAECARTHLDRVIEASVDDLPDKTFQRAAFDCIIFADVLEHLRSPAEILAKCRNWLDDEGTLVVSVPNSRHHSVVRGLAEGNWTYEHAGLLDEDHVRCFTRRELEKLLFRSGYTLDELSCAWGSGYRQWKDSGMPAQLELGNITVRNPTADDAQEFFVYQYLARAIRRKRSTFALTSIFICTCNQLAYTRQCVESIVSKTDVPYELIFVDNGSSDGTPNYLRSIEGARVLENESNRGFAIAANQGIRIADGEQILLLNNDTLVTTGWLESLLEALYDRPTTGMVGPVSNSVSGPQKIPVRYDDLTSLDGFAWGLRSNRQLTEVDRLVGFCLLVRREVVDKIGLLDERFEVGCFEDDDWSRRASLAGFKCYIASHVFVHHFGSVTFRSEGFDFAEVMDQNRLRYEEKWRAHGEQHGVPSIAEPTDMLGQDCSPSGEEEAPLPRYREKRLANGELLLQRQCVQLSLCMIVRDNESTIKDCLESIYPWVDELIIVDTGSTDRTVEICRQFGATIREFPWCDDFSGARNASLEPARGEWIFWMDSDDVIPPEQGRKLRQLALGEHREEVYGYVVQVQCPSGGPGQMTVVDHVKLIRNRPELRFEHRIHEQILPAIRAAGGTIEFTDIHVVHSGSRQDPATRQRKLERDFRILKLDLEERPDHPFVLFNLGMTYEDAGDYEQGEEHLRRCIEVAQRGESQLPKAWALRVNCFRAQGKMEKALELATQALQEFPGDKELLFRRGMLYQDAGRFDEAVEDYRRVLNESTERVFQSLDPAICGYKARHKMAMALQALGRAEEARGLWKDAVAECWEFSSAWLALFRSYLSEGRLRDAEGVLAQMPNELNACAQTLATALLHEAKGDIQSAAGVLMADHWQMAESSEDLDEIARILVTAGRAGHAIPVLRKLQTVRPGDAAVLHNLGAALQAVGDSEAAIPYLHDSLSLRIDGVHTSRVLSHAYRDCGQTLSARDVLTDALELHPNDRLLREALDELNEPA
ncbi:MAG: glycosyltransferase [Candidatus Paceibacterota bacterium]